MSEYKRLTNVCPSCGRQHVPAAMVSEANSDLKRRWGLTPVEVLDELECNDFIGLEGIAVMHALQEATTAKLEREALS